MAHRPAPGFQKYPGYQINFSPEPEHVSVAAGETTIAESSRAIRVQESKHHTVWYLPMEDVNAALLSPSETETYCPFKGTARYWHVNAGDQHIEDALWAYPEAFDECSAIEGYASFYADRVEIRIGGDAEAASPPGFAT